MTELLGYVGVDSGMLRIIDPCYTPTETYDQRLANDEFPSPWIKGRENETATNVPVEPLGIELGLDVTGWGGDGYYPVTAHTNSEGLITSITIDFQ